MQEALVVRCETHIPAPPAAVFALLTDPEKILSWVGTEAQLDPRAGRPFRLLGRGRAGPPPGLQLWLGWQRNGPAGSEPHRDRPDRAAGRDAAAPDPFR